MFELILPWSVELRNSSPGIERSDRSPGLQVFSAFSIAARMDEPSRTDEADTSDTCLVDKGEVGGLLGAQTFQTI